nr:MAG TPA: hypothetical protein [Caudoviricetes sp.]
MVCLLFLDRGTKQRAILHTETDTRPSIGRESTGLDRCFP